jgi:branched-chain amino acid transport system permease protein
LIVNAVSLGAIYACLGLGFSLIYGVVNIINLAYGAYLMVGAYTTYWLFARFGLDPFLSVPLTAAVAFGLGYLMQRAIINRAMRINIISAMILTYGFDLIAINLILVFWSADYQVITTAYSGRSLNLGGWANLPYTAIGILIACGILALLLNLFLNGTRTGIAIQAASLNPTSARLVGIRIEAVYAVAFGVGSALAAAAGSLLATSFPVYPGVGDAFLGLVFVVTVLGGLGNVWGAVVGGLALAAIEMASVPLLGPSFQQLVAFSVFVAVLVLRPYGLVGRQFFAELK